MLSIIYTIEEAKDLAKKRKEHLKKLGIDLSHSQCLEMISWEHGYKNWDTYCAFLKNFESETDFSVGLLFHTFGWKFASEFEKYYYANQDEAHIDTFRDMSCLQALQIKYGPTYMPVAYPFILLSNFSDLPKHRFKNSEVTYDFITPHGVLDFLENIFLDEKSGVIFVDNNRWYVFSGIEDKQLISLFKKELEEFENGFNVTQKFEKQVAEKYYYWYEDLYLLKVYLNHYGWFFENNESGKILLKRNQDIVDTDCDTFLELKASFEWEENYGLGLRIKKVLCSKFSKSTAETEEDFVFDILSLPEYNDCD